MTTIFLNLGARRTGGELLARAPFRAFVKFNTAFDEKGGVEVLPLWRNEYQIGTATIDWREVAVGHRLRRGKYYVGGGSLDEIDIQSGPQLADKGKHELVLISMMRATWDLDLYDSSLSESQVQSLFTAWISDHLNQ